MSEEQLKSFLEAVKTDTSLQEKLKAEDSDPVAIANAAGFTIFLDDIKVAKSKLIEEEPEGLVGENRDNLTEEELERLVGGTREHVNRPPWSSSKDTGMGCY